MWAMSQIVSDIKVPDFFVCLERRVRLLLYSLMQIYILLHLILATFIPQIGASLIAQLVKNPPAMQETLVQFLGQEDPLETG